jgi:hypothetical protein
MKIFVHGFSGFTQILILSVSGAHRARVYQCTIFPSGDMPTAPQTMKISHEDTKTQRCNLLFFASFAAWRELFTEQAP